MLKLKISGSVFLMVEISCEATNVLFSTVQVGIVGADATILLSSQASKQLQIVQIKQKNLALLWIFIQNYICDLFGCE